MTQQPAYQQLVEHLEQKNAALREDFQELKKLEQLCRLTLENISDAVVITEDDGRIIYACPNSRGIFGLSQNEVYGLGEIQALLNGPIFTISELKRSGEIPNIAWSIADNAGHTHHLLITVKSVRIQKGTILYVMRDITELKQAQDVLKASLQEKEILLRELYHRTKNMMQMISSMLKLQAARTANNVAVQKLVADTDNRILTMALVHQKLYQSQDLSRIQIQEYIGELADVLIQSYKCPPHRFTLSLDIQPMRVLLDTAIPCGLVLNELLSNAVKHAFPEDHQGEISIRFFRNDAGNLELHVADNGVGVPQTFDFRKQETLGLQTIIALAEHQLHGRVAFAGDHGVTCVIEFSDDLYTERV